MDHDDAPVVVFSGEYAEAIFLQSLLESAGIEISLETSFMGGIGAVFPLTKSRAPTLRVRRRDFDKATGLVQDFLQNRSRPSNP